MQHGQRMGLGVEYPLVERDDVILRKQQEEILEPAQSEYHYE